MDEDEDEELPDSDTAPTREQDTPPRSNGRASESTDVSQEDFTSTRIVHVPPVARELMMTRDSGRQPTPRAHAHPTPGWHQGQLTPRRQRGFAHQPIVELSTSPTPSDVASVRSTGTSQSTGTAFFRSYTEANPAARLGGTLTPDLVFAEIGHGRGAGPGPSTILAQNHCRRDAAVEPSLHAASSAPQSIGLPPGSADMSSSEAPSTPRGFRAPHYDPRHDSGHNRTVVLTDTSNSYQRASPHPHTDRHPGFAVVRESTPPPPSPTTTRELHESVHSALAAAESRGRSVKRTLRNTFAAAETFFSGRASGGSAHDTAPGPRDGDTHGH